MSLAYRLYLMDPDGHIRQVIELACAGDEAAIGEAERVSAGARPMELWHGARMIRGWTAVAQEAGAELG